MNEKISIKYYLLSVVVPIICIFIAFGYTIKYMNDKISFVEHELVGLKKINEVHDIVVYLQRLRGITRMNTPSKKYDLLKNEYIDRTKKYINTLEVNLKSNPIQYLPLSSLSSFVFSIKQLFENQNKYSKNEIFHNYTKINERSFDIQKEISLKANLKLDNETYTNLLIETVVSQLPALIENTGQLRALLTSKGSTQISKREFVDLSNKMSVITDLFNALSFNINNILILDDIEKVNLNRQYITTINSKDKLFNYINTNFEKNMALNNSEKIYDFFTLNINSIIDLYSLNSKLIRNSLINRLDSNLQIKKYLIIFELLCIWFILYNFLNFYRKNKNLIGTIRKTSNDLKSLKTVLDEVGACIYTKDLKGHYTFANNLVIDLFNVPLKDIIGKDDTCFYDLTFSNELQENDARVLYHGEVIKKEEIKITKNTGETKIYWSVKEPLYDLHGKIIGMRGISTDITEIHNLKEELKKQSITDSLTSVFNKRHFNDIATNEFRRSIRYEIDMSIIILDIDFFKKINDTYGHVVGDRILQRISQNCKSLIRAEDVLCRIGGEEFAILLPQTKMSSAAELAERIRTYQENQILTGEWEGEIKITFSLGVSHLKYYDNSYEDILLRADKALYKAKDLGRNRVISLE